MRRFFLLGLLLLPPLQARDLESSLGALRRNLRGHSATQKKLTLLQHRAALVGGVHAETAAVLERLADSSDRGAVSRTLSELRERLGAVAGTHDADFLAIETKLAGLGLPEKLLAWREFVSHYRARLAEVEAELAFLGANVGDLPESVLHQRLAALRAKFGPTAAERDPRGVSGTGDFVPQAGAVWSAHAEAQPRPATDTPTPDDLAETKIVQLTPEIRALAAALGNDPAALNNWVGTQVEYVPYFGQMQNSPAVLFSRQANDFDQATLLVALLRAAGIPARYVAGAISLSLQDVKDWTGTKDSGAALQLLSWNWNCTQSGNTVVTSHVWVEAWLDTSAGKQWLALDPSVKHRSYQPGIALPRPAYDRTSYLRTSQPVLPADLYLDGVLADFRAKYPGRGFDEVTYLGTMLPPPAPVVQSPYTVTAAGWRQSAPPAQFQSQISLRLLEHSTGSQLLQVDLSLPEVVLQSLTVSFVPATAADLTVAEAFGGIANAPAAVVNLLPQIRLDGAVIATGTRALPTATNLDLILTYTSGVGGAAPFSFDPHYLQAGDTAAMAISANQISDELVLSRIESYLSKLPGLTADEATREMLYIASLRYFDRNRTCEQRLASALDMRFVHKLRIDDAVSMATSDTQYLFDRPFVVTPGELVINVHIRSAPIDIRTSQQNTPDVHAVFTVHNDSTSALEHEVWEELALIPSVSTMKVLQAAVTQNVPIDVINSSNAAAMISALDTPPTISKNNLLQWATGGFTLTVPRRAVSFGSYTWFGVAAERFETTDYFDLVGQYLGGKTASPAKPHPPQDDPGAIGSAEGTQGTTCSDPVNVSNGNLFEQMVDYALRGPGPGITFQRAYNSLALAGGPLGPGWRHSYQMSLQDSGATVTVIDESGSVLRFTLAGRAYVSPPGYNLTLVRGRVGFLLWRKDGTRYWFSASGLLQGIADRNQRAVRLSYVSGQLRQIADQHGRSITLGYDSGGRLTGLSDFMGRQVTYEYDSGGRLSGVVDLAGNRTMYSYYSDSIFHDRLKSMTTAEGRVTSFEYYGSGKVSRVNDPGGRSISFLYLPLRNETHVIDEQDYLTTYQYNALGNVVQVIRADGGVIGMVYSADAKLLAQTDAAGYTTSLTYDSQGNLTSVTDPLGRKVTITYQALFNLPTSIQDARGNTTRLEYDRGGNLTRVVQPTGIETRFTWDTWGNPTSATDAEGNSFSFRHDAVGNLVEARDALGNPFAMEYDQLGHVTRTLDGMGGSRRREYNVAGDLVKITDELGQTSSAAYDREERLAQVTDFAGNTTKFAYDAMSHLTQVTDALGQLTKYLYSTTDCGCTATRALALFRDPSGVSRSQSYDFLDRMTATTDALGNITQYGYETRGLIGRKADGNGGAILFQYDAAGRLTRKSFSDGTAASFTYDPNGNLLSAANQNTTLTFTYDELNRVTSAADSRFAQTIRYGYDRQGRRTALTGPDGSLTNYTYDANGQVSSLASPSGTWVQFSYDALVRLMALTYSNRSSTAFQYDAAGRILSVTQPGGAITYTYDPNGNPTTITDAAGLHANQYDRLDRLTGAQHPVSAAESYAYDAAGNRARSASDTNWRYDAAGRLTAAEGATFTYDKNGNVVTRTTSAGTTKYGWDIENRLVRVDLPGGGVVTYKYDPLGRRIEKSVNGTVTTYLYDGTAVLAEMDGRGQAVARYAHGPGVDWPLLLQRGGQTYFYLRDALGSVVALADTAGNVVRSYAYDSWGKPRSTGGSGPPNPFQFTGREYETETGLYYMRARYYDPTLGRFLSMDALDLPGMLVTGQSPLHERALLPAAAASVLRATRPGPVTFLNALEQLTPQALNTYAYAANNPLRRRDPSGLMGTVGGVCGVSSPAEMLKEARDRMTELVGGLNSPWMQELMGTSEPHEEAPPEIKLGPLNTEGGVITFDDYAESKRKELWNDPKALEKHVNEIISKMKYSTSSIYSK